MTSDRSLLLATLEEAQLDGFGLSPEGPNGLSVRIARKGDSSRRKADIAIQSSTSVYGLEDVDGYEQAYPVGSTFYLAAFEAHADQPAGWLRLTPIHELRSLPNLFGVPQAPGNLALDVGGFTGGGIAAPRDVNQALVRGLEVLLGPLNGRTLRYTQCRPEHAGRFRSIGYRICSEPFHAPGWSGMWVAGIHAPPELESPWAGSRPPVVRRIASDSLPL